MIILIYGGSGSGKSEFAEQKILSCAGSEQHYYIATMIPYGEEGRQRVQRHTALRQGKGFITIECPTDIRTALDRIASPRTASLLIECVSNLTANEMFENGLCAADTQAKVIKDICLLCSQAANTVIVTNNIFDDGMEYSPETISYAIALGTVNQALAELADEVYEVTAGIAKRIAKDKNDAEDRREKMKLVIGGFAQGKLAYVIRNIKTDYLILDESAFPGGKADTANATSADPAFAREAARFPVIIVNHLHQIIRRIGQRDAAQAWIRNLIDTCTERGQELILISDEVGNGVIPMEADERQFREDTGRILCDLAGEAEQVERIICGLPQILK